MRKEYLNVPFEMKAIDDNGRVEGYGAIFGNVDLGLDKINRGAFRESLKRRKKSDPLPMLWQHDGGEPIGVWDNAYEDSKGLFVAGQLNLDKDSGSADVPAAWKARALAKQRAVKGLSIGYFAEDYKFEGDVRVLNKVDVVEVSMATFPMNPLAQMTDVKHLTNKEFVQIARDTMGLSRQAAEALRADGLRGLRDYIGSRQSGDDESVVTSLKRLKHIIEGT